MSPEVAVHSGIHAVWTVVFTGSTSSETQKEFQVLAQNLHLWEQRASGADADAGGSVYMSILAWIVLGSAALLG
jgi:hypothetical protein